MFTLIIGGSGSGKSKIAEEHILSFKSDSRYYIATMEIYGDEELLKVERHKQLRKGKGFNTIECPIDINNIKDSINKKSAVLIECVTNLVANEMYRTDFIYDKTDSDIFIDNITNKITEDILSIRNYSENVVVVTGNVSDDGIDYDAETKSYICILNKVNERLAHECDMFIEVVAGIPVILKEKNINA